MDILNDEILKPETDTKTDLDVLKELFDIKNIETKTELNINQVILINQKSTIADLLGFESLQQTLQHFMLVSISNRRAGRSEFVDAFKSEREAKINQSGGFLSSMRNKLNM